MNRHELIDQLRTYFPTPPIYQTRRVGEIHEWILERGIEAGRKEVIDYLENLWGLSPNPHRELEDVRTPENRPAADEYGRTAAPASPAGPDPG